MEIPGDLQETNRERMLRGPSLRQKECRCSASKLHKNLKVLRVHLQLLMLLGPEGSIALIPARPAGRQDAAFLPGS